MQPRTVADVRLMLNGKWPPNATEPQPAQVIKEPDGTKESEGSLVEPEAIVPLVPRRARRKT